MNEPATGAFEMKMCPICRGSGQYCTTYPRHFSPCGECNGTGKVRTYVELLSKAPQPAKQPAIPHTAPGLRLRLKVWTDPATDKRYLMASAFMRDVRNGQPISDVMCAYAMSDEDTKLITIREQEWNALPFYYFQEDGPAPRAAARPLDVMP